MADLSGEHGVEVADPDDGELDGEMADLDGDPRTATREIWKASYTARRKTGWASWTARWNGGWARVWEDGEEDGKGIFP